MYPYPILPKYYGVKDMRPSNGRGFV